MVDDGASTEPDFLDDELDGPVDFVREGLTELRQVALDEVLSQLGKDVLGAQQPVGALHCQPDNEVTRVALVEDVGVNHGTDGLAGHATRRRR